MVKTYGQSGCQRSEIRRPFGLRCDRHGGVARQARDAHWPHEDYLQEVLSAELARLQQRLRRVEVLIIDELGFVPFDRVGGELLFNLIADRYERQATVVTTNLAFAEWVTVFAGDEKLTTALLDRLAHHATVITTKGKSYRMRKRRGQG